jgi:hypothetical protein
MFNEMLDVSKNPELFRLGIRLLSSRALSYLVRHIYVIILLQKETSSFQSSSKRTTCYSNGKKCFKLTATSIRIL